MNGERGRLARLLDLLMQIALAAILAMIFLLVVLRYGFHTTIIGGNEATLVAFVYASVIAAALALRDDEHIAVRYFTNKMTRENRDVVAIARWLLLMCINLVLLGYSVVWIRQTGQFLMPAMGLPQWIAQISVPIGCGLGFGYCTRECLSAIAVFRNRADSRC
ncbi:MAG: TRAP transporter small permease subunit [Proteobacteria bacterium]|nr:TRAP transporter small permease subunit [Pseudomonadota bacterium]